MAKPPTAAKNAADETLPETEGEAAPAKPSRRKLIFIGGAVAALLLLVGGLWITGILPRMLGEKPPQKVTGPVYVKIPEIVANLDVPGGQDSYVKLEATIELADAKSAKIATADMPRIVDVFQTYLRAMRPGELRGASGTYRLREALIDRIEVATAPAVVKDILFQELIVQ
ncbi:flagellar basal body-associated FliL family protein [Acidiphilium sp. C61]|jgi:flagellar FliL protein|uniref:flagellar basal body-associated FliL family protein n=1 Tax=Acidiphilium sp. C61 TaxID=1671485 RepID=UPI00157A9822|nr:flagellar basal body-associated FliL family protein [Acidiphilium sp. C61]